MKNRDRILVSIVTPSFNQGNFLEETIRSVLGQNYNNIEYILMDGASSDQSIDIIRKYESSLKYWVSVPDKGQAAAISSGFEKASGDILGYINSDDVYCPGAIEQVVEIFRNNPEVDWVIGKSKIIDENGVFLYNWNPPHINYFSLLFAGPYFHQPASFWRKSAYKAVGGMDIDMQFAFDYDFYLKLAKRNSPYKIHKQLAAFRVHSGSKTHNLQDVCKHESEKMKQKYGYYRYPRIWISFFNFLFLRYIRFIQFFSF